MTRHRKNPKGSHFVARCSLGAQYRLIYFHDDYDNDVIWNEFFIFVRCQYRSSFHYFIVRVPNKILAKPMMILWIVNKKNIVYVEIHYYRVIVAGRCLWIRNIENMKRSAPKTPPISFSIHLMFWIISKKRQDIEWKIWTDHSTDLFNGKQIAIEFLIRTLTQRDKSQTYVEALWRSAIVA